MFRGFGAALFLVRGSILACRPVFVRFVRRMENALVRQTKRLYYVGDVHQFVICHRVLGQ